MANVSRLRVTWQAVACALFLALSIPALSKADDTVEFDIASQPLSAALKTFAEQAKMQILYRQDVVQGAMGNPVVGSYDKRNALQQLIRGTGLEIVFSADNAATIRTKSDVSANIQGVATKEPVALRLVKTENTQISGTAERTKNSELSSDSSENKGQLEEVIVTATKREASLQDIPLSVTVLNEQQLVKQGAVDFADYASRVPNLSFGAVSDTALNSFGMQIRGIAGNGTTGFYIDDVPISERMNPRVMDISRIEVLRGPQGSLYGARSMGGTVRLITKRANPSQPEFKVHSSLGGVTNGGLDYAADMAFNVPLSGNAAIRSNVYYQRESGVHDIVVDNPTISGDEITRKNADEGQYWGFQTMVTWNVSDTFTVEPRFMYQKSHLDWEPYSDLAPGNFTASRAIDIAEPQNADWSIGSLTLNWNTDWGRFTSATAYMKSELDSSEEWSGFWNFLSGLAGDPNYFPPGGLLMTRNQRTKQLTEEIRFTSTLQGRLQMTAGLFYSKNTFDLLLPCSFARGFSEATRTALGLPLGTDCTFFAEIDTKVQEVALFGELEFALLDSLTLTAGGRYFDNSFRNSRFQWGMLDVYPPGPINDSEQNETGFNPKAALNWKVNNDWTVYSSAAKGVRIGGTNNPMPPLCAPDLAALGLSRAPDSFHSDSVWSYEIGSKSIHAADRFSLNVAAFFVDWKDIIQTTRLNCDFSFTNNTGKAESRGVEVEVSGRPIHSLTYNLGIGYTDAKITDPEDATGVFEGDRLAQVPKWTFTGNAEYRFNLGAQEGYVFLDYRWIDDSVSTNQGIASPRERDSYEVLDARLGMTFGGWDVSLFGKNLTNEHANLADARALAAYPPDLTRYVINRPRTIGIDVRWQF